MDPRWKLEPDPDGLSQQVAVIMTGKVYRDAGLKHSKHPEVEGLLYDKLCESGKHPLRDDVRKLALNIALNVRDKDFIPTVAWLDNFMRRFCLSKKKRGFHSMNMLKTKDKSKQDQMGTGLGDNKGLTQEEIFSTLGFTKDFPGLVELGMENGSSSREGANEKSSEENGISGESKSKNKGNSSAADPVPVTDGETSAQTVVISDSGDSKSNSVNGSNQEESLIEAMEVEPVQAKAVDAPLQMEDQESLELEGNNKSPSLPNKESEAPSRIKGENKKDSENCELAEYKKENDHSVEINKESSREEKPSKLKDDDDNKSVVIESNDSSNDDPKEQDSSNFSESDPCSENDEDGKKKTKLTAEEEQERKKSKQEEDEECIQYTKEEDKYFRKNREDLQKRLNASVVRCTSCYEQVNHQLRNLVHTHPVLGVFICKRCRKYYGKGKFCKDEDGYDEYCRLCAEGGDLLCCEQKDCFNGFCKRCIKRTMGRSELKNAETAKKWACYVCNPTPMMELRALHRQILNNLHKEEEQKSTLSRIALKEKEIKNKFALLKTQRFEKAQKVNLESKKIPSKGSPRLRHIIDSFSGILIDCLDNIQKIEDVWAKYKYSKEATAKTAKRICKQSVQIRSVLELMEKDINEETAKLYSEMSEKEKGDLSSLVISQCESSASGIASREMEVDLQMLSSDNEGKNDKEKSKEKKEILNKHSDDKKSALEDDNTKKISSMECSKSETNTNASDDKDKNDEERKIETSDGSDVSKPRRRGRPKKSGTDMAVGRRGRPKKGITDSDDSQDEKEKIGKVSKIIPEKEDTLLNNDHSEDDIDSQDSSKAPLRSWEASVDTNNENNAITDDDDSHDINESHDPLEKKKRRRRSPKKATQLDANSETAVSQLNSEDSNLSKDKKAGDELCDDDELSIISEENNEKSKKAGKTQKEVKEEGNANIKETTKSKKSEKEKSDANESGENKRCTAQSKIVEEKSENADEEREDGDTEVNIKQERVDTKEESSEIKVKVKKEEISVPIKSENLSDETDDKKRKGKDDDRDARNKKPSKKQNRKTTLDDSDDSLLGIGTSDCDDTPEENTDEEIQRRRDDHKAKEKKNKQKRDHGKNKKDTVAKKKGKAMNDDSYENRKALSSLLASNSSDDNEDDEGAGSKDKSSKKGKGKLKKKTLKSPVKGTKTVISETSDSEDSEERSSRKQLKDKNKKKGTDDNEKAKDALLNSESDDDLEDKPKPKCKKKNFKEPRETLPHLSGRQRYIRWKRKKLSEEEREKLKKQQLDSRLEVKLEKLGPTVLEALENDECIDIKEHPTLDYDPAEQDQGTYDGDAEEDDSDREFSRLMKFDVDKKFCKPGPKSKKKFLLTESEDEEEEEDEDEVRDGKGSKITSRKKKEGLLDINISKDDQDEDEDDEIFDKKKKSRESISINEKMKKNLLMSSDDDDDEEEEEEERSNPDEAEKELKKHELRKKKKKEEEKKEEEKKEEEENEEEEKAPRVSKKGYMKLVITSDEDDEDFKAKKGKDNDDDYDEEDEDSDFEESPRKRRTFQISSSGSDSEGTSSKKKRKKEDSSYTESEEEVEEEPKAKRKRIKKVSSSSDEGGDEDEEKNKEDTPGKHKKIRRVIRDEDLMETTKNATQEEEERKKRIAERQKQFNNIFEVDVESDQQDLGKLVLDFNPKTKEELVRVHEKLVKNLKPHQFKGIKFMWNSTIESIEMLEKKPGSGCILAHCMGLGKTLQVISFIHTLLTCKKTNQLVQRVMVCCPVNTVYNWVAEFSQWLKGKMLPFDVYELVSAKDLWGRAYRLDDWWREGGVCVIGYDMYRNLSNSKGKRFKGKMKEIFQKALVDPGPDMMVCDEGHVLKNEKTALSIAINKVKTLRRIVLTGTPLQNNLKEYHCMIQFVKPNLLGTKKEFMNRFVNPIEQGQCADAQPRDVRRMKRRAHILHNMLEGCVQRFDYTVLKPFLPPKFEFVVSIQLSEMQCKLYRYYLDNLAQGGPKRQGSGLFVDFGNLSRVWTHPKVLDLAVRRAMLDDDEDDMDDFICDDSTSEESSEDERAKKKKKGGRGRPKAKDDDDEVIEEEIIDDAKEGSPGPIPGLTASGKVKVDWWKKVLEDIVGEDYEEDTFFDKIEHSGKLILLLEILRDCCSIGDKVLVFSQSLLALDMIEEFLAMLDQGELELPELDEALPQPFKKWKRDRDYLRLDGSSSADLRKQLCKSFNNPDNERCRLFLISTRAGGLGINLVAANRVIIFDSSWNPSHDSQSIFRVYRFGQKKPCYIYRFVAQGTMEEKIYSRQVTKMSTALRVVDEHQIKRYFKMDELAQLYEFTPVDIKERETPAVPEDRLLAELLKRQKDWIVTYHEHDSLLENQTSEELSEEERKAAWEDYENEKKGFMTYNQRTGVMPVVNSMSMPTHAGLPSLSLASFSFEGVVNTIKAQNPNLSQNELCESVVLATKQIQRIHLNHYQRVQGMIYNLKNPMIAPEQRKLLPFGNHPEMLPMLEQQLRLLEDNIQKENQVINHMTQITPQRKDNAASLIQAGLMRGQPATAETAAASADLVTRAVVPGYSYHGAQQLQQAVQQQQKQLQNPAAKKKEGSSDVIMLD